MWKRIFAQLPRTGLRTLINRVASAADEVARLREEVDHLRSRLDLGPDAPRAFWSDRSSDEYQSVYAKREPLVTVCIATFNRGQLVAERAVRSVLAQDYKNLQLLVVGDHCTDDTEQRLAQIRDSRLHFTNLSEHGDYPEDGELRWMVAGTAPVNRALELAEGDFITHLDDDDEHERDRTVKLLERIREANADVVWHPFWVETPRGSWRLNLARQFAAGQVSTSSVFYHRWLKRIPWDLNAYTYREPGDWNRFRKFRYLGARAVRHSAPLLRHYRERNQRSP